MIMMVANMFQQTTESWKIGTQSAEMNSSARAALDFMATELRSAVAGTVAGHTNSINFELVNGSELKFVTLLGAANERALRGSLFRLDEAQHGIEYWRNTDTFKPYQEAPSWDSAQLLIGNVVGMTNCVYLTFNDLVSGNSALDYNASLNNYVLPFCVDLSVTMMSEDNIAKYMNVSLSMPVSDKAAFVARNSKTYTTRVYFDNREGYLPR